MQLDITFFAILTCVTEKSKPKLNIIVIMEWRLLISILFYKL